MSPVAARIHSFLFFIRRRKRVIMSAIPVHFPVTMTDGEREYLVPNATAYMNAVFSLGHRPVEAAEEAVAEAKSKPRKRAA